MPYCLLSSRSLIRIGGADALSFLQGVLTCDVRPTFEGRSIVYGALLSPQGKFLHDLFLLPWEGGVLLDVDAGRAADLLARLKLYRLRSAVTMEPLEDQQLYALWGEEANGQGLPDPRLPALGARLVAGAAPKGQQANEAEYHHHRLTLGVPDGARDMIVERSLLLEFGIDHLHGVDFGKGCYIGQEVTARSKFRGQVRKGLYCVSAESTLPECGTAIVQDGKEVGLLRSVSGKIGLALVQHEAVAQGAALLAGQVTIVATLPQWMSEGA